MGTRLYYVQLFDKKVINIDFLIHKLGADKKILRLFRDSMASGVISMLKS